MEDWLVLQNFYEGLTTISMEHLNATAGGAFLSLTIENATTLIKKIVANQSWGEGRETQDGMHSVKETGLLAAKVDLRIKRLDDHATKLTKGTVQTMGSHMKCEVCGDVGHLGNNCPKTQEETSYINDGFRQHHQPGNNGWNNHNHPQGNSSNFNTNYDFNHLSLRSFVLEQPEFNAYLAKNFPSMIECLNLKMLSLKLCLLLLNVG
jgi:hypothetical protein